MEQRTLLIDDRIIYAYDDGSVEFAYSTGPKLGHQVNKRTFGHPTGHGYLRICINGKSYSVHSLIALAFIGSRPEGLQVDHINRNKCDNRPENLRYVTREENQANRDYTENCTKKYGVRPIKDKKLYQHQYGKSYGPKYRASHVNLNARLPSGKLTTYHFKSKDDEIYKLLKPLSFEERYIARMSTVIDNTTVKRK